MRNGLKLKNLALNSRARLIFLGITLCILVLFLVASSSLVKQLALQEKERMDIWAQATQRLAAADENTDVDFLLSIISENNSIPVLVSDSDFNIVEVRNYDIPEDLLIARLKDTLGSLSLEEASAINPHIIRIEVYYNYPQYIFYEDSLLLKRLSWFPYVQLGVTLILLLIIYIGLIYTKKSEQNRLWAGLSKETAHQLGTPISSLMAWQQYLESTGTDRSVTEELGKDISRLSMIADRFSKIGSEPELKSGNILAIIEKSLEYMSRRISGRIKINIHFPVEELNVELSEPLFQWVMENLIKNAADAMEGEGSIDITAGREENKAWIEIKDTGKGISKKNFKKVFHAGYTTKKRGWGLGLTLVNRIIEEYHKGRIYVKESEIGKGTTFRIEIPLSS